MSYTIQETIPLTFDEAVEKTIAALEDEGFGVLCDIDVQSTLEEKLGATFEQYRILGACNPQLAHDALTEEISLGALLPCNVIVYETDRDEVTVAAVDPEQLVGLTGNDELAATATAIRDRFQRVLHRVSTEPGAVMDG